MVSKVALTSGNDRCENIKKALNLIEGDFLDKLKSAKNVVIKPNFVVVSSPLACTKGEACGAAIEVIREHYQGKISIAEGAAMGDTFEGYDRYGYRDLVKKHGVELIDLNDRDDWKEIKIYNGDLAKSETIRISQFLIDSDFLISCGPPKTHDSTIITLGIKNITVGAIHNSDRQSIHAGPAAINKSIVEILKYVSPDLTIIDGYEGMEGRGPSNGELVPHRICVAGTDPVATDSVGAKLMGYQPDDIGYLYFAAKESLGENDLSKIEVLGERIEDHIKKYKHHPNYDCEIEWKKLSNR